MLKACLFFAVCVVSSQCARRHAGTAASMLQVSKVEPDICTDLDNCAWQDGCKHVSFIRHAEGEHQVALDEAAADPETQAEVKKAKETMSESEAAAVAERLENWPTYWENSAAEKLTDAVLSSKGRHQCRQDRAQMTDFTLVVVSPLRRTFETAYLLFQTKNASTPSFIVHDLCRERYGEFTCDRRNKMSENRDWQPGGNNVDKDFWKHWDWETQKTSPLASERPLNMPYADDDMVWSSEREPLDETIQRSQFFLLWLLTRPEEKVAVVTHSSFMQNMLGTPFVPKNVQPLHTVICPIVN
jgi:broad specificity phosphatase PhoE